MHRDHLRKHVSKYTILSTQLIKSQKREHFDSLGGLLVKKDKTKKDCEAIFGQIHAMKGFTMFLNSFLKGLRQDQIIDLCSKFEYKKYLKGDILFRQGEKHDNKLYLILQGSVMIFINRSMDEVFANHTTTAKANQKPANKDDTEQKEEEQQLTQLIEKKMSISLLGKLKGMIKNAFSNSKTDSAASPSITPEEKEHLMKKFGNTTRQLDSGMYFGEKALLNNDKRSATIVVDEHMSEIITLEKKYFQPVLHDLQNLVYSRKETITGLFHEMTTYTTEKLDNMLYCFQIESCVKGMHLCEGNTFGEKLFIIQEGEVQLISNIEIQKPNGKIKRQMTTITILSAGAIVGEEILFLESQKYHFTCTVLSPTATILVSDKKSILSKFPQSIKDLMHITYRRKQHLHTNLLHQKKIELQQQSDALEASSLPMIQTPVEEQNPNRILLQNSARFTQMKQTTSKSSHTIESPIQEPEKFLSLKNPFDFGHKPSRLATIQYKNASTSKSNSSKSIFQIPTEEQEYPSIINNLFKNHQYDLLQFKLSRANIDQKTQPSKSNLTKNLSKNDITKDTPLKHQQNPSSLSSFRMTTIEDLLKQGESFIDRCQNSDRSTNNLISPSSVSITMIPPPPPSNKNSTVNKSVKDLKNPGQFSLANFRISQKSTVLKTETSLATIIPNPVKMLSSDQLDIGNNYENIPRKQTSKLSSVFHSNSTPFKEDTKQSEPYFSIYNNDEAAAQPIKGITKRKPNLLELKIPQLKSLSILSNSQTNSPQILTSRSRHRHNYSEYSSLLTSASPTLSLNTPTMHKKHRSQFDDTCNNNNTDNTETKQSTSSRFQIPHITQKVHSEYTNSTQNDDDNNFIVKQLNGIQTPTQLDRHLKLLLAKSSISEKRLHIFKGMKESLNHKKPSSFFNLHQEDAPKEYSFSINSIQIQKKYPEVL